MSIIYTYSLFCSKYDFSTAETLGNFILFSVYLNRIRDFRIKMSIKHITVIKILYTLYVYLFSNDTELVISIRLFFLLLQH